MSNFKHINAAQQILDGTITAPLFAPGAVTVAAMNIDANLSFNEFQALEFRIENVSTTPVPGNVGRVIYNTTTQQFLIDNGTAFVPIASSGAVTGIYSDSNPILTGSIQLVSGTNVTLSQVGQSITINSVGGSGGVSSLNSLSGALTLAAGSNITIIPSGGNTLTIASTGSSATYQQDLFSYSGSNVFTLSFVPISNSQLVFWNGIALVSGASYDYVLSGTTLTLNVGVVLKTGDQILVFYSH